MAKGYISLMLHAHLPFVYHPEKDDILEESWLYEAITETYVPLIQMYEHFINDNIHFRITMSLTPPLIEMLKKPLLQTRYLHHIDRLIELAEKELDRTANEPHFHGLALMYWRKFKESKEVFKRYNCDLVEAFKNFQDMGCLEIITCGVTHGFLPLIGVNKQCIHGQIDIAARHYEKHFGRRPRGIWLPECGYTPDADAILKDAGIDYFFTDTHGVVNAEPRPRYGVYAPIISECGVAAFARDVESSKQVWSSKEGYPGDVDYREYYKDIGWEREYDYIKPYIHPEGFRVNTGIKYWRITSSGEYKEAYRPDWAEEKAAMHAQDFILNRQKQIDHLSHHMDRKPIIVAPYDAELYGHWWYEGPMWIDFLVRKITYDQTDVAMITPSDYLKEYPVNQMARPCPSSWGDKGYNDYWLNDTNDWIYPHLEMAGKRMEELANQFQSVYDSSKVTLIKRALNQAARELLLAQSSDWPFIMKAGTMVPYACRRFKVHINRFTKIYEDLKTGHIDEDWLKAVETRDEFLQDIDCGSYFVSDHKQDITLDNPIPAGVYT